MKQVFAKLNARTVIILMLLAAVGISVQGYLAAKGQQYTHYNNYVIFKSSFAHLLQNKNLYVGYPAEHYDLYKYSPAFALFMGLFYYLPNWLGLTIFNLLNAGLLIMGLRRLHLQENRMKYLLLFLFIELAISMSMSQTNALIAGLIILGFSYLEEDKPFVAALLISLTVFIKLFGLMAFAIWFLYRYKGRFFLYALFWMAVLALIPLMVVSPAHLWEQYHNWLVLLKNDHDASYGISFMGWMHSWLGIELPKNAVVLAAATMFCLPLLRTSLYKLYTYRLHILGSILLWIVIFNHKGENPTYIIAMSGVAIWYFSQESVPWRKLLLWLALIFTSFSSTDLITPGKIADRFVEPYALKAVFCCVIWFVLVWKLMTTKKYANLGSAV